MKSCKSMKQQLAFYSELLHQIHNKTSHFKE